uniref:WGS project CBMG000000000 data, contig CS5907-c000684 n=1 Tax=Fusarium acuminatum CS5907 TaxID=1318461 RepID=A0A096PFC0_9HYPO|nr:unnamed protein product [Fusarium acuminatum CS5907]
MVRVSVPIQLPDHIQTRETGKPDSPEEGELATPGPKSQESPHSTTTTTEPDGSRGTDSLARITRRYQPPVRRGV